MGRGGASWRQTEVPKEQVTMARQDIAYFTSLDEAKRSVNTALTSVAVDQQVVVWDTNYGRFVVAIYQDEAPGSNAVWKADVRKKV